MNRQREIEKQIKRWELDGEDANIGRLLLGSALFGPNYRRLSKRFGFSRQWAAPIAQRLRQNRVWVGRRVAAAWFANDGGIAFMADVCVAKGYMTRTPG